MTGKRERVMELRCLTVSPPLLIDWYMPAWTIFIWCVFYRKFPGALLCNVLNQMAIKRVWQKLLLQFRSVLYWTKMLSYDKIKWSLPKPFFTYCIWIDDMKRRTTHINIRHFMHVLARTVWTMCYHAYKLQLGPRWITPDRHRSFQTHLEC